MTLAATGWFCRIGDRFDAADDLSAFLARVPLEANTALNRGHVSTGTESNGRFKTYFQGARFGEKTDHNMNFFIHL